MSIPSLWLILPPLAFLGLEFLLEKYITLIYHYGYYGQFYLILLLHQIDQKAQTVIIFELTVPYGKECPYKTPVKFHKYAHLVIDLLNIVFEVKFYAIEIGCRGLISMNNSNRFYVFCHAVPGFKFKQVDFSSPWSLLRRYPHFGSPCLL